jgi:HSP20 family protein
MHESPPPPQLAQWGPLEEVQELRTQLTRLLSGFADMVPVIQNGFAPAADIEETDDAYIVELELPGVSKRDIDVSLSGQVLTIAGERKEKERVGIVRRRVRSIGRFYYDVQFPEPVRESELTAKLADGVLTVRVPKAADAAPKVRRVEVK